MELLKDLYETVGPFKATFLLTCIVGWLFLILKVVIRFDKLNEPIYSFFSSTSKTEEEDSDDTEKLPRGTEPCAPVLPSDYQPIS